MKSILICLFSIFATLISNSVLFAKEIITVRADFWCPYNCKPDNAKPGFMIEVLQKAFPQSTIQYEELNWARSIKETRDGKWDVIVGAAKSDAPDFIFPENNFGGASNCFYLKKDNKWQYKDISSLENMTLGVIQDYAYVEDINHYIKVNGKNSKKVQVHSGNDALIRMLQKLALNRINVIVEDENVMGYALKYYPKFTDVRKDKCIVVDNLYAAFSPAFKDKSVARAKQLDKKMSEMEKNGEMDKLLEKYGVEPWYKKNTK